VPWLAVRLGRSIEMLWIRRCEFLAKSAEQHVGGGATPDNARNVTYGRGGQRLR
jgi:hypothetical protein